MESVKKPSKRIEYIDIAKGIAIILMIIGHTIPEGKLKNIIYSFHMPLFFLISGYFFKPQSTKDLFVKTVKRLLLPYAITSVMVIFLNILKKAVQLDLQGMWKLGKRVLIASLYGSGMDMFLYPGSEIEIPQAGAIWFLLALFWGYFILNFAVKHKWGWIAMLLFAVIGVVTVDYIWLPWSIQPGLTCYVYLYSGYLCRKYDVIQRIDKMFVVICAAFIWFVGAWFCGHMWMVNNSYESGILNFIFAYPGMFTVIILSEWIEMHMDRLKRMFLFFGKDTLIILCVHLVELRVLNVWEVRNLLIEKHRQFALLVYVAIVVCRIILAYISVLVKKKSKILQRIF